MIEKCSIGNMTNNIQNITLILLILILIIVIIYYLKNSNAKHNELIEKYTNTPIISSDASYNTHYSANSQRNSNFPSTGTTVTLRDCQVQFNNTFDGNKNSTVKYTYGDEWKEIDTLTEPGSSSIRIPEKIISRSNETNEADITNYSERSKCFRKMSSTASDNKYRYAGNNLIQYRAGSASEQGFHSELKVGTNGTPENYMEMKFNLAPSNRSNYYTNLTSSICSLQYTNNLGSDTGSGLGGLSLYRLTLNAANTITAINQITINSDNNHIFTVSPTTSFADLLTSTSTISYVYSGGNFYFQSNSSLSAATTNPIGVKIYRFNRELLCSHVQKNIKSYTIIDNKVIDANKIVNVSTASVSQVINSTNFPNAASSYASKNAVKTAIEQRINTEIATANTQTISEETTANNNIATRTGERDAFLTSINTKEKYLDKIFDATLDVSKKDFLISLGDLELDKLGYQTEDVSSDELILSSSQEPSFSIRKNNQDVDIYTIEKYTDTSVPYTKTFITNTTCDILVVGGGGGGGGGLGGGGGAGAVVHLSAVEIPAGTYTISVGSGGAGNQRMYASGKGLDSSIVNSNNTIRIIAEGGGGTTKGYDQGKGSVGGSGGGAASPNQNINTGGAAGTSSSLGGFVGKIYGNKGGDNTAFRNGDVTNACGGGGAGTPAANTAPRSNVPGDGRDGFSFNITGKDIFYGGGGGGGGHPTPGRGGKGGGGYGSSYTYYRNGGNGTANTGGGGGGGCWADTYGGNGGSGIVIIRYRNVPELNGNEKEITLNYNDDNNLIFTYRTDEPNYSWEEAYNEAIANGKRMTTIQELRDYMDTSPTVFSQFNEKDVWIPVLNPEEATSRDWVQGGTGHPRKRSHLHNFGYPGWGNDTGENYAKVYFEVKDSYQSITYNFNPYKNLTSWINYAKSIGAITNVDSFDSKHGVWYPNDGEGYLSLILNNDNYNYVKVYFGCTYPNGRVILRINDEVKETCYPGQFKTYSQSYNKGDVLTIAELTTSIIARNLTITLENRILNYKATLPTKTDVSINGNTATLEIGTYDIIMGPLSSKIINNTTKILIGNYAHRDGNKLTLKYAITKTLQQLHNLTTTFSSTVNTIGKDNQKYLLGSKTSGIIKKYRVYIYKRYNINHVIELYVGDTSLINETDYKIKFSDEDAVPKTINLYNLYITINKHIAGIIYLKSDKPIFFISEESRTSFNNTTDIQFETNVNKLKASGSPTLTRLNNLFEVSEANTALTTAQNRKITYNINTNSESPLTISYNSSTINTINPAGKNSLDNLRTTYNNIHKYNESSGGALTEKINEYTFGNILNPVETNIEKYISYEYPTAPSADQLTPSNRNTPYDIRSNATKYIYFRKDAEAPASSVQTSIANPMPVSNFFIPTFADYTPTTHAQVTSSTDRFMVFTTATFNHSFTIPTGGLICDILIIRKKQPKFSYPRV